MPPPHACSPLTLIVVSESVTCDVGYLRPILVLGLCVLDLCPMYATDVRCTSSLTASALWGRGT